MWIFDYTGGQCPIPHVFQGPTGQASSAVECESWTLFFKPLEILSQPGVTFSRACTDEYSAKYYRRPSANLWSSL